MKQKDIALILIVAVVAAVFSLVLTQMLFGGGKKELTAQKVDRISSEFKQPDKAVFNNQAINPTQLIQIGENANIVQF